MKLKYSIRRQVTALFIALLAFILGGVLVINSGFLVSYYLSHKTEELVKTYNEIDRTLQNGDLTDLSVLKTILVRTERGNIDLVVVDSSGKAQISTMGQDDPRFNQMVGRYSPGISTARMYCEETAILQCTDRSRRESAEVMWSI